jgi:5-methylcytosine-specific restriction endonuclease McrA
MLLDPVTGIKRCSNKDCQETDPAKFGKNKRLGDGLSTYCRDCAKAAHRARYTANPEKAKAAVRACRAANPEKERAAHKTWNAANSEKKKAADRARYAANPEKKKAARKARRAANPEKERAAVRAWVAANPEKAKAIKQRRRARKLSLPTQWTAADWKQCLNHFGHRCAYCGISDVEFEQDHLIPLAQSRLPEGMKGMGGTVPWNMVPACKPCNRRKHNHNPFTWDNPSTRWAPIWGLFAADPLRKYVEIDDDDDALRSKPDTHLCRGARDLQLRFMTAVGILKEPTDKAFNDKSKELGVV